MRSDWKLRSPTAGFLFALCALNGGPGAVAQTSCMVTYTCPAGSGGANGCAGLMGGAVTRGGPYPYASKADCEVKAKGNSGLIISCSCSGAASGADSAPAAPAAPGHEFDSTIKQAISAGVAGKLSPGNAIGFVGLGMLGNALLAPKTTNPVQQQDQPQINVAAQQLNNSGVYLLKHGNYIGAINEFQKALAETPGDANILHNLEMAKQKLKDSASAGQTSGALGQLLGSPPAGIGKSDTALNLVNVDSNPNIVDLTGATRRSQESLEGELDGVLAGNTPASSPSSPQAVEPQAQRQDIDQLFQSPRSMPPPPPMDAEQKQAEQKQVEDIFKDPGSSTDSSASLKDAPADSTSDQNSAPPPRSNSAGNGTSATTGTGTGFFGSSNANPSASSVPLPTNPQTAPSAPGTDINASHQLKATAGGSIKALGLGDQEAGSSAAGQPFDRGGNKSDSDAAPVVLVSTPTAAPVLSPGAAALAAHIPDTARNNPAIQNAFAFYQKLDSQKSDAQGKLNAVQQQIDSGTGDAQVLNAQKAALTNNLNQYNSDQANTQEQIKKIVVGYNVSWSEDPQPVTASTPATSNTPATSTSPTTP
jgi:hypothetical protein